MFFIPFFIIIFYYNLGEASITTASTTFKKEKIKKFHLKSNKKWTKKEERNSPLVRLPADEFWPVSLKPSKAKIFQSLDYSKYSSKVRQNQLILNFFLN